MRHLFSLLLVCLLVCPMLGQDIWDTDLYGKQNAEMLKHQKNMAAALEKISTLLEEQSKSLRDNLSLLTSVIINNSNYIQDLEKEKRQLIATLEKVNNVMNMNAREIKNIRLELNQLKNAIRDLNKTVARPQRNE